MSKNSHRYLFFSDNIKELIKKDRDFSFELCALKAEKMSLRMLKVMLIVV